MISIDFLTLSTSPTTRLIIIYGLMMTYTFVVVLSRPYKNEPLNTLNIWWSLVSSGMILIIALFEYPGASENDVNGLANAAVVVIAMLCIGTVIVYARRVLSARKLRKTTALMPHVHNDNAKSVDVAALERFS